MKRFLKKHYSNILFLMLVVLLIVPQTRMPIQVFVQRIIAFSPSAIDKEDREQLEDYNWMLQDLNGKKLALEQMKGKVVLINLWATWCPPCVAEMPSLQALYNDYGEDVVFLFISSESTGKLEGFMEKNQYDFPVYRPLSLPPKQMDSNTLPTTYVLDKSGTIVVSKTGAADWNSKKTRGLLDKLLAE